MSKVITVIQYPPCSTCRAAVKSLKAKGFEVTARHIVEETPSAEELQKLLDLSGLDIKKLFNTSGEVYRELGLKDKLADMSHNDKLKLLASHGMLIKRSIATDGKRVTVGYKEEQYAEVWGSDETDA